MIAQPNFLFIITDQQRANHLGCYGNRVLRTPNIDRLASAGTSFDRFYVANPACMPNRAVLMTGRPSSINGVRCNGIPLSLEANTFVELLRVSGYDTAAVGKVHLQTMATHPPIQEPRVDGRRPPPKSHRDADFVWRRSDLYMQESKDRWENDPDHDLRLPYYGFAHVDLTAMHADDIHGHYTRWLADRHPDPKSLVGRANALPFKGISDFQAWRTRVPEELYSTSYIAEKAEAYLRSRAHSNGHPFFLQCSFNDPHHPFTPPGRYFDMYDPTDVELPRSFHSNSADVPPPVALLRRMRDEGLLDRENWTVKAVHEADVRQALALTYGSIAMIDDAIGRILKALAETGQSDNTIVVFTSDHGDFMGDHQLILKGPLHYDGLVRVPFIWSEPGQESARRTSALASTMDIGATILARAGLSPYHDMQGVNLLPVIVEAATAVRDCHLIEEDNQRAFLGFSEAVRVRSLITPRWRLSVFRGASWGELYDLEEDPLETRNLWDDAGHGTVRRELEMQLLHKTIEQQTHSPLPVGLL